MQAGEPTPSQCPACEATSFDVAYADTPSNLDRIFTVFVCQQCHLGITRPQPTDAEIAILYPTEYYRSDTDTTPNPLARFGRYLVHRVLRGRDELVKGVSVGKILDIGCGNGVFLKRMADKGWQTAGTDYSASAVMLAKSFVDDIRQGSLADAAFDAHSFNIISMFHVLEHIPDLESHLREVHRLLAANGRLIIEVPNRRSLGAAAFKEHWFGHDVPRHLYHFTPGSLVRLLRKNQFNVVQLHGSIPLSNGYIAFRSAAAASGRAANLFDRDFEGRSALNQLFLLIRFVPLLIICLAIVVLEQFVPRRSEAIRIVCTKA